jgi:CDP-glycerol glycerophosphotransferase (TagB/SpsB family)
VNIESHFERAYVLAARQLQIPIVNAILSFDNLTSKPAHLIYDHYLVWSQRMKEQLLRFYPQVSDSQVTVTGTPQFDFHRRPNFLWSRRDTLERLGLPPGARYFLYTTTTKNLAPAEPNLVAGIARRMHAHEALRDYWLVVRTHPLEDWGRWEGVLDRSEHAVLSHAWDSMPDEERWALTIPGDQARFVSSLAHAEACLNVASTTALDAAILDRPVIGIRFDHEREAPAEIIYQGYDADHYRPLVKSGGLRIAHNWSELMGLLQQAIIMPEQDKEARARMVAQECGVVDGRAAERVADALLSYLERTNTQYE